MTSDLVYWITIAQARRRSYFWFSLGLLLGSWLTIGLVITFPPPPSH